MNAMKKSWDYLIITASNDSQARAYQLQLDLRRKAGLLDDFSNVMVVADPEGKRIGSGGSTIYCLLEVLRRELPRQAAVAADWPVIEGILRRLRILIIHAGGDSKRLPAYGPCGKIFIPVPGESRSGVCATVFDHLLKTLLPFPVAFGGHGQVLIAAGDALIRFDPSRIKLAPQGLTALGCYAAAEESAKHGVFCAQQSGPVRLYLQKPSPALQAQTGALNRERLSILDVGAMNFDASVAMTLLKAFEVANDGKSRLEWSPTMHETILARGLDLYREICCALGSEATPDHLLANARSSGSTWDETLLRKIFDKLNLIPFFIEVLAQCSFLHFGTTKQLVESGLELTHQLTGACFPEKPLSLNNVILPGGAMSGPNCWVEGCRISAPLLMAGQNVVVGVDVDEPLALPLGACLDVLSGRDRGGQAVWFARCYHVKDTFKDSVEKGATFCGRPLPEWLAKAGVKPQDVWDATMPETSRSLWDARVFPAVKYPGDWRNWIWMFDSAQPTGTQTKAFLGADRYSAAEIAALADQDAFFSRRGQL
jgi:fucokinase